MARYSAAFRENQIDLHKLLCPEIFTEQFVADTLGVNDKQHAKKLCSAAKKLQVHVAQQELDAVFDSCSEQEPYRFTLGKGEVLKVCCWSVAGNVLQEASRAWRTERQREKERQRKRGVVMGERRR